MYKSFCSTRFVFVSCTFNMWLKKKKINVRPPNVKMLHPSLNLRAHLRLKIQTDWIDGPNGLIGLSICYQSEQADWMVRTAKAGSKQIDWSIDLVIIRFDY